jgi:ATP-dependent Clp protease adapter protein ClpS
MSNKNRKTKLPAPRVASQHASAARDIRSHPNYPPNYEVILFGDKEPFYEGVAMEVLTAVFRKSTEQAKAICDCVYQHGYGYVATYTYDVAETKIHHAEDYAGYRLLPMVDLKVTPA